MNRVFRIDPAGRIDDQWAGPVAAAFEASLNGLDKPYILGNRRIAILLRQRIDHRRVVFIVGVPAAFHRDGFNAGRDESVGVEHVARIDLKRHRRPQEPRAVVTGVRHAHVDVVGHAVEVGRNRRVMKDVPAVRRDVIGPGVDHACRERRVIERTVIAFGIVLDRDFPVAPLLDANRRIKLEPFDIRHIGPELFLDAREPLVHGLRIVVEIDEDEAAKDLDPHRCQTNSRFVETRNLLGCRRTDQAAVRIVRPRVIRTDDPFDPALSAQQFMRPMGADVVETPDLAVAVADQKQALAENLERPVVARFRHHRLVADELPRSKEHPVVFEAINFRVGVVTRIERRV